MRGLILLLLAGSLGARDQPNSSPPHDALAAPMLQAQNEVRRGLSLPPLRWSGALADSAQAWADRLAVENRLHPRPNPKFGENQYLVGGATANPQQVVKAWADEAADYDLKANRCRAAHCGHYTQMVWRATEQVGCAMSKGNKTEVWVCDYDPPGNVVGERPY